MSATHTLDIPKLIHGIRERVVPIDARPIVIDLERCQGPYLYDLNSGTRKIDFACHYASLPLGYNHPALHDAEYERELLETSRIKIANLDVLSESYGRFLEVFMRIQGEGFSHVFFVDGGALANENALKAAFDWKVRRNMHAGKGERGFEVLHFQQAFHGRSGYTLSLTNTADPNKTKFFPKFDWPRVSNPYCTFPLQNDNLHDTVMREQAAMAEIEAVMAKKADDIAAIIIEPIQGEGGDNHFRPEFLQFLRDICDRHNTMLVFDEVQCGMGITGDRWAWQTYGVKPDFVTFAKKAQVGGFLCTERLQEEPHNVFKVPSRISSTWGAGLPDMVRARVYLETYERENIWENVRARGKELTAHLDRIAEETELITNVRGMGLMCAFDLTYPEMRAKLLDTLEVRGLLLLPCGTKSIRFRPPLNVTSEVLGEALALLHDCLREAEVPSHVATT
jgi:L-lysine 6-transaminase